MLNFTVGPVQSSEEVLAVGGRQTPYFRTAEFSSIMYENEILMKKFTHAEESARAVFITGSGTAAMEAAVCNSLFAKDKVLIVNGGSFGQRFVDLCNVYGIAYDEIKLRWGHGLTENDLMPYEGKKYTAFLVNVHETSTGVHYDLDLIHDFCKRNQLFLIVDAISSFLADPINMRESEIDVLITGSQKALACPPGISILVLSERAIDRIQKNTPRCFYLDVKSALKNGERGQTPFTPAVSILLQIHARLREIDLAGGEKSENERIAKLALDFRSKIKDLPLEITSDSLSNAITPLHPLNTPAYDVFLTMKDEYKIWICPNGGELKDVIFRVGHIGALTEKDNDVLAAALHDMQRRKKLL